MSVSESLGRSISPISRARGASYFRSGAVRSLSVENRVIEAQVRGTRRETVRWSVVGTGNGSITPSGLYTPPDSMGTVGPSQVLVSEVLRRESSKSPLR